MTLVGFEFNDLNVLQTVFPLGKDGVVRERVDVFDLYGGPVGDEFFPVLFGRIRNGRPFGLRSAPKCLRSRVSTSRVP